MAGVIEVNPSKHCSRGRFLGFDLGQRFKPEFPDCHSLGYRPRPLDVHVAFGSQPVNLRMSKCFPVYPQLRTWAGEAGASLVGPGAVILAKPLTQNMRPSSGFSLDLGPLPRSFLFCRAQRDLIAALRGTASISSSTRRAGVQRLRKLVSRHVGGQLLERILIEWNISDVGEVVGAFLWGEAVAAALRHPAISFSIQVRITSRTAGSRNCSTARSVSNAPR
jgi:hypothetical protein